jgi:hypothetical protein
MAAVIRELESLYGLIEVARDEAPPNILNIGVTIDDRYELENYVRMNALPIELQTEIRRFIHEYGKSGKVDPETKKEMEKASKDIY